LLRPKPALELLSISRLGGLPQFPVLLANGRVELAGQADRQARRADQLQDVGKVAEAMGRGEPGGELELDQPGKRQQGSPNAANGNLGRVRKAYGLGRPSPGYSPVRTTAIGTPCSTSRSPRLPANFST
jgi:hypothetical protein